MHIAILELLSDSSSGLLDAGSPLEIDSFDQVWDTTVGVVFELVAGELFDSNGNS